MHRRSLHLKRSSSVRCHESEGGGEFSREAWAVMLVNAYSTAAAAADGADVLPVENHLRSQRAQHRHALRRRHGIAGENAVPASLGQTESRAPLRSHGHRHVRGHYGS